MYGSPPAANNKSEMLSQISQLTHWNMDKHIHLLYLLLILLYFLGVIRANKLTDKYKNLFMIENKI